MLMILYADDIILGGKLHTIKKVSKDVVVASKESGQERIKLSSWSCLKIRIQDEVTKQNFIIISLTGWTSSKYYERT
jgi:hypothetical protein